MLPEAGAPIGVGRRSRPGLRRSSAGRPDRRRRTGEPRHRGRCRRSRPAPAPHGAPTVAASSSFGFGDRRLGTCICSLRRGNGVGGARLVASNSAFDNTALDSALDRSELELSVHVRRAGADHRRGRRPIRRLRRRARRGDWAQRRFAVRRVGDEIEATPAAAARSAPVGVESRKAPVRSLSGSRSQASSAVDR